MTTPGAAGFRTIEVMDQLTSRRHLARYLAPFAAVVAQRDASLDGATADGALGLDNRVADEFVTCQLRRSSRAARGWLVAPAASTSPSDPVRRVAEVCAIEVCLDRALAANPDIVGALWPLLTRASDGDHAIAVEPTRHRNAALRWVFGRHAAAGMLLTATIAAVIFVGAWAEHFQLGSLSPIELAVVFILSFLPGWLYIRFIGQRAGRSGTSSCSTCTASASTSPSTCRSRR